MIGAAVRRGLAAGLLAGVFAGLFGLVVGEPALESAIALEDAAGDDGSGVDAAPAVSRGQQRVGLVVGSALFGLAVGALFGVASAWAVGRLSGDAWTRSLKLGVTALLALVVLPALKYPPNPPGASDPASVGDRTVLYLGLAACGLLLAAAAWTGARWLTEAGRSRVSSQAIAGGGVVAIAGMLLAGLPGLPDAAGFPGDLLWRFRLSSLGTQAILWAGTAVAFGLLSARAESRHPSGGGATLHPG